jgi:hypothetical protein
MIVRIVQGKSDWQFLEKEDSRTCEVVHIKTKIEYTGFINSVSTNGTYEVELKEEIKGYR